MYSKVHDSGLFSVMVENLERGGIPRALTLLDKVNRGETMSDFDIVFLEQGFSDARELKPLFDRHPEYQDLAAQVLGLYEKIARKAFENEMTARNV
ncbi:MAG: hypothetical protein EP297_06185 [Gammaproteobacteria bacterium]|nr:MAG: hypothetical protein EP297_06185 [Gammaproteobacteria bacterium]